MKPILVLSLAAFGLSPIINAQPVPAFTRSFQISLLPGIGSNGMHGGGFSNFFSINLTSGYSSRTYVTEVGGISNLNTDETRGLQIAGLANVTGGDAFAGLSSRESDKRVREGFEANLSGLQVSGLANLVLNNVFGGQVTAGVNLAKGAMVGAQVAGISNTVYKYAFGVQLAGLYNVAARSMDGVQVASFFNVTEGELFGIQFAIFNRAGSTEGVNSRLENNDPSGVQIGLINIAGKANGFQIGLINNAKRMQGTQIGLVNIFTGGKTPQTRDGTAIGLINTGNAFYMAAYSGSTFLTTYELATGTLKNGRIVNDRTTRLVMNALIYAVNPAFATNRPHWAVGYGLKKMFFNRSVTPGMGMIRYLSFGLDILHVNGERKKFMKELSLLTRPAVTAGSRLHPKNKTFYFFVTAMYNVYFSGDGGTREPIFPEHPGNHWPGIAAGVMVR